MSIHTFCLSDIKLRIKTWCCFCYIINGRHFFRIIKFHSNNENLNKTFNFNCNGIDLIQNQMGQIENSVLIDDRYSQTVSS